MLPSLVFLLRSRLAGADEEESIKIVLCIGVIMMQQNNIRRMTPFRRTNDYNVARTSMWRYLESPDRAVPTLSRKRHSSSPIVEIMESGSEAEFRCMFRLSRTVFAALVVELSPWITNGRSYNGDQNVTAEAKIAIALYFMAHGGNGFTLGVAAKLKKNIQCKEGTEGCRKRRADSSLGAGPVSKRQSQPFPDAYDMSSFPAFGNLNEDMSFSAGLASACAGLASGSASCAGLARGSRQLARGARGRPLGRTLYLGERDHAYCKEGSRKLRADSSLGAGPASKRQSQPFPYAYDVPSFPAFGNLNEDMSFSAGLAGLAEASGDRVGLRVVHGNLRQLARREPRASRRSLTGLAPSELSARRLRQPSNRYF